MLEYCTTGSSFFWERWTHIDELSPKRIWPGHIKSVRSNHIYDARHFRLSRLKSARTEIDSRRSNKSHYLNGDSLKSYYATVHVSAVIIIIKGPLRYHHRANDCKFQVIRAHCCGGAGPVVQDRQKEQLKLYQQHPWATQLLWTEIKSFKYPFAFKSGRCRAP